MQVVEVAGARLAYLPLGPPLDQAPVQVIWAHGWGQDHRAFLPMAQAMQGRGAQILLDFPGFGASPRPSETWGTADYADAAAAFLKALPRARRIWVGHSFGCRVGLQLAARHPDAVDGLFLIAAAGLPRPRPLVQRMRIKARLWTFKLLKSLPKFGIDTSAARTRFGSADYRNAGEMRPIFVKTVGENLTDVAKAVPVPVQLVYGGQDDDTPPAVGEQFARLIPEGALTVIPRFDHHTILTEGAHQVQHQLGRFIARIAPR